MVLLKTNQFAIYITKDVSTLCVLLVIVPSLEIEKMYQVESIVQLLHNHFN